MLKTMSTAFLTLAAVLVPDCLQAQEAVSDPPWNIGLKGGAAYVARTFDWRDEMMSTYIYPTGSIELGYQTTEKDSPYAALYGFPNFGVGIGWDGISSLRYNGISRLDSILDLYGFVERNLLRAGRFSMDLFFDLGAGYNRAVYDPEKNPLNRNFGSHVLVYVSGGLSFQVSLTDRLAAGVEAQFCHYSTGRLGYPNAGLNNPAACLSLQYRNAQVPGRQHARKAFESLPSRFFYEVYAGCGIHRCAIEWSATGTTTPWALFAFGGSANWRYRPHLSTGLAADVYAATDEFLDRLRENERVLYGSEQVDAYGPYRKFSGGVGIIQHLHYGNFSAFATVGAYLYRHNGLQDQKGKLYQRVGLKYVLPGRSGLFVAADCKAHRFSRAAMMELTFGIRFPSTAPTR